MDELIKPKVQLEQVHEKKQEFKHFARIRKKGRNLTLFALDPESGEVYKVKIEKRSQLDISSMKEVATHKAVVNPNHPTVFKLNVKNAKKFFRSKGFDC